MTTRQKRILLIAVLLLSLSMVTGLILLALTENINLFFTPTQLVDEAKKLNKLNDKSNNKQYLKIRLGGMVENGSVKKEANSQVKFAITDFNQSIGVEYKGILPDLFREGQGIVVQGRFLNGIFKADTVFAKHDEKYTTKNTGNKN